MATLGNIRNRSGLLLSVIGIAMLAFILGDFMQSKRSGGGGSSFVGEVLGEDVSIQAYESRVEEGLNNWKNQNPEGTLNQTITNQVRSQIWDQYVRELIMNNEFSKIGVDVSDEEFFELLQGVNVHPEISKIPTFQDPLTGIFDRTRVLGYLKQIEQDPTGEAKNRWIGFQGYLIGLIKSAKYNALVRNAMYVTQEDAKSYFNETSQNLTFKYVSIPYISIVDSLAIPTSKQIKRYYSDHKSEYEQKQSKDVEYVVFNVIPSKDDDINTKSEIEELVIDFTNYEDCILMARRTSDNTKAKFRFSTKDKLEDPEWIDLFDKDVGTVIGPYTLRQGVYRIAKLFASEYRPDSVEARHILIKPTQQMGLDSVTQRIDDLKIQIQAGADFGNLAQTYSDDKNSAIKGGDLDWFQEGVMVDEFNEVCFTSKKGELNTITTQFGVHLIQVTNISKKVKKSKIVFIDRNIEPSTATFNYYYSEAAQFAGKILNERVSFDSLVSKNNLLKRSDSKVQHDKQNIIGLPNSREMVRWMNTAEKGDVSEVFQFDNTYVVAFLTNIYEEGFVPLEQINEQIKALVRNQNKAKIISESHTGGSDLSVIAGNNNTVVNTKQIKFNSLNIDGIGYEPELIGALFRLNKGVISDPIEGKNSIFIVEVIEKDDLIVSGDFSQQQEKIETQTKASSGNSVYNALKKDANIEDNRSDFY